MPSQDRWRLLGCSATIWMELVLPHSVMFPGKFDFASTSCSRCLIRRSRCRMGRSHCRIGRRRLAPGDCTEHHRVRPIMAPILDPPLQRAQLTVRERARTRRLQSLEQLAARPPWLGIEPLAHLRCDRHEGVRTPPTSLRSLWSSRCRTHLALLPRRPQAVEELLERRNACRGRGVRGRPVGPRAVRCATYRITSCCCALAPNGRIQPMRAQSPMFARARRSTQPGGRP
jgi:hypothetical protein